MKNRSIETIIGAFIICVAIYFVVFAKKEVNPSEKDAYVLSAKFDRIDGLTDGADVRLSGLKIGKIQTRTLDEATYLANVVFSISENVKIPDDSSVEIIGDGLFGSKYLAIVPGGSDAYLADGGEILFTQSSVSIEALIGKFIYGGSEDSGNTEAGNNAGEDGEDIF